MNPFQNGRGNEISNDDINVNVNCSLSDGLADAAGATSAVYPLKVEMVATTVLKRMERTKPSNKVQPPANRGMEEIY